jgi:Ca2+-binding EF-hand superfamily protein
VPFFLLDPSDHGRELLAAAIIERYDRNKDGKLSPNEIGFSPDVRRRLTGSPDGTINRKQIARWSELSSDLELLVHLQGAGSEGIDIQSSKLAKAASLTRTGIVHLKLPREQIEIVRLDTAPQRAQRLKQIGTQLFDSLAGNGDKLMSKDIFRPPFALVPVFRLADRNGDNTLTRAEYQAFLDIQQKLVTRSLVVSLLDRGHSLFDFLDADHDHRLSKRELLTAWDRISPWADTKTHSIDFDRIPHQYQIVIRHGKPEQPEADPGAASAARPESRLRGPIWFRKMDRNADGDVSRAEFLGSDEQFRKLDLNGDGMIDLQEAEAAGRKRK